MRWRVPRGHAYAEDVIDYVAEDIVARRLTLDRQDNGHTRAKRGRTDRSG